MSSYVYISCARQIYEEPLSDEAQYGNLPFDRYALVKWDHSKERAGDQQQWNDLVHEWLALTPRERHPYHEFGPDSPQRDASVPISERYERVLVPFQTAYERNYPGDGYPIWLRTCYKAELLENYERMSPWGDRCIMLNKQHIFDNEAIYGDLATDWTKILLRLPNLPDSVQYIVDGPPEEIWDEPEAECERPMWEAEKAVTAVICLVDEEALREDIVKVLWLDCHGNCVWDNKFSMEGMNGMDGMDLFGSRHSSTGMGLGELTQSSDWIDKPDHPAYKRGYMLW